MSINPKNIKDYIELARELVIDLENTGGLNQVIGSDENAPLQNAYIIEVAKMLQKEDHK